MKNITVVVNFNSRSTGFEEYFNFFKSKYLFHVVIIEQDRGELGNFLNDLSVSYEVIKPVNKYLFFIQVIKLCLCFIKHKTDIVHCHLFESSLYGLMAAKIVGVKKRIHTRHHGSLHHDFFPGAIKYDRLINKLSTNIVSVSKVTTNILVDKEGVEPDKITEIAHVFNSKLFENINDARVKAIRAKYNLDQKDFIIGVISRYIEWKGIQYIIPAFKELLKTQPNLVLVLANAKGNYQNSIKSHLKTLPNNSFREISFESDLHALFRAFNIFVHVPINKNAEAFGQVYVESILSEIPSVFTVSGEANYLKEFKDGIEWVDYEDSISVKSAMEKIIRNYEHYQKDIIKTKKSILDYYTIENQYNKFSKIYNEL